MQFSWAMAKVSDKAQFKMLLVGRYGGRGNLTQAGSEFELPSITGHAWIESSTSKVGLSLLQVRDHTLAHHAFGSMFSTQHHPLLALGTCSVTHCRPSLLGEGSGTGQGGRGEEQDVGGGPLLSLTPCSPGQLRGKRRKGRKKPHLV